MIRLLPLAIAVVAYDLVIAQILKGALYLDLPLIFTLYVGFYSPPLKAGVCGTAFGLLQDALPSGLYLGLNGLLKTLLGFGIATVSRWVAWDRIATCFTIVGLASLLDRLTAQLLLGMGGQPFYQGFWFDWIAGGVLTGVVGGLLFRLLDRIRTQPQWWRKKT